MVCARVQQSPALDIISCRRVSEEDSETAVQQWEL